MTNGRGWTIFEVEAFDENGTPCTDDLRSFQRLPLGLAEYEVERKDHPKYGTTYWLKGQASGNRMDRLEERVEELERQVRSLRGGAQ